MKNSDLIKYFTEQVKQKDYSIQLNNKKEK
jgi:hypothetical protein